ncbi:MAG TPA: HEAT repeat domain-containing protein, partial [Candidatus Acidoferrales bacterium]|nr:HEAT repeat domain-containing protein [Candidatus Acidoferrales bacterium]
TLPRSALDALTADPLTAVRALLDDADPSVAAKAADLLAHWGDRGATPGVVRLLQHRDPIVRLSAATALGTLADPASTEALIQAAGDADANVRAQACSALGTIGQARAAPVLRERLGDADASVRAAAVGALATMASSGDVVALLGLLQDHDAGVVTAAAEALGRSGDEQAVAPLIALLRYADEVPRCAAVIALGRLGDPAAVGPLVEQLRSHDLTVRIATLRALGTLGDPAALPAMLDAAADGNPIVAERLPYALARLYARSDHEAFAGYLRSPNPNVRAAVALALGVAGDGRAASLLRQALTDPAGAVRLGAVEALGLLGLPDSTDVLRHVNEQDPDPQVREAAAVAVVLVQQPASSLTQRLRDSLHDPDPAVRRSAADVLGFLGVTEDAVAVLRHAAEADTDATVANAAMLAVLRMDDPTL